MRAVHFVQPVPVFGTSSREDYFAEPDWQVSVDGNSVVLYRPEKGVRPEVPAFRVVGVGFAVAVEPQTEAVKPLAKVARR